MIDAPAVVAGEEWGHPPVVDAHVHVNRFDLMRASARALIAQNPTFATMEPLTKDPALFLEHMDEEGIEEAWCINYCARDVMGYGQEVNEWASRFVAHDPQRLKSTGGYDPRHDGDGQDAARRLRDLRLIGAKIHPVHQALSPDIHEAEDTQEAAHMQAFYEEMQRSGMPVWFHTGTSIFPGADNSKRHVAPIDRVAADFPRLKIVLCHGGRPHECDEALAMMRRRPNVWMDVSSMPPRRIPDWFAGMDDVWRKVLWGSDWPGPKVPGMMENVFLFLTLGYPEDVARGILGENARALLAGNPSA